MIRAMSSLLLLALLHAPGAASAGVDCMECHDDAVDAKAFAASVHHEGGPEDEALSPSCVGCHGEVTIEDDEHEAPAPVSCGKCHAAAARAHASGKHGARPAAEVAACTTCHGAHDIKDKADPESRVHQLRESEVCLSCHLEGQDPALAATRDKVAEYKTSVHWRSLSRGGLVCAASCVDCHGSHGIPGDDAADAPTSRARVSRTCGACHLGVLRTYEGSVHGQELAKGDLDVPVCTDCHGDHDAQSHYEKGSSIYATNVPDTCLKCHADQAFIGRHGFPGLRAETYLQSYHGAAAKLGDTSVANCASCHTAHDIRASSDPRSTTHPDQLQETCGDCHKTEDPSKWMEIGKVHQGTAQESHWVTALVEKLYILLIVGTMGFFLTFMAFDLRRKLKKK